MKITLEGITIHDILDQMRSVLHASTRGGGISPAPVDVPKTTLGELFDEPQGPGPEAARAVKHPVDKPVDKPVDISKPMDPRITKMQAAKKAKAAAKAAGAAPPPPTPNPKVPEETDPAKIVQIRQKTIEELQAAYANGFQKEVFELLSRFGNGAKSFRELPPDAFLPIREAIDNGALT